MSESRVTEIPHVKAPLGQRARPALVLSIGIVEAGKNHPTKLDHFRAKPGPYAAKFAEIFGDAPTEIDVAVPDDFAATLDIRWKAYGKSQGGNSYLKALGHSNYVERAITGDASAVNGPETLTVWSKEGKKGEVEISGPDDVFVAKTGLKIYTTFRFWMPSVLGLGSWAEVATTGEVSTHNLFSVLHQQWRRLQGQWVGLPLILYLQPITMRPTVEGKRISSKGWALAVRTPLTVDEFVEQMKALAPIQDRKALPPVAHDNADRDFEISAPLFGDARSEAMREQLEGLPTPPDEPLRTRQEPMAADVADDATVNRIATLRLELGDVADSLLVGAYGVEDPDQLDGPQARAYVQGLERLHEQHASASATTSDVEEPEVVEEGEYEPVDDDGLPSF